MRKLIGQVTIEEKNEIQTLFERKNGLNELAKIITKDNNDLYEQMVKDMGVTSIKFQKWWDEKSVKYNWPREEDSNWEIDFDSCEIYLVKI